LKALPLDGNTVACGLLRDYTRKFRYATLAALDLKNVNFLIRCAASLAEEGGRNVNSSIKDVLCLASSLVG
jgi:hypothetical protein